MKMNWIKLPKSNERGATLVEFAIAASVFMVAMFAVLEFGRLLWVHNALSDAARRGARYASVHSMTDGTGSKNVAVCGNPKSTVSRLDNDLTQANGSPLCNDLTPPNVQVAYVLFDVNRATVSVSITNYQFQFVVPIIGTTITMPTYNTTLTGECAGRVPASL